jgi:hypothetical protein
MVAYSSWACMSDGYVLPLMQEQGDDSMPLYLDVRVLGSIVLVLAMVYISRFFVGDTKKPVSGDKKPDVVPPQDNPVWLPFKRSDSGNTPGG